MALVTRGNNMRLLRGGRVRALIMPGKPKNSLNSLLDKYTGFSSAFSPNEFS